jgi:hypothetical protein
MRRYSMGQKDLTRHLKNIAGLGPLAARRFGKMDNELVSVNLDTRYVVANKGSNRRLAVTVAVPSHVPCSALVLMLWHRQL